MTNKDYEEKEFFEEIFQEEVQEEQQEEVVEEEIVKPKKSSRKKKNSFEDTFIIPTEKLLPNRLPIIPIQGHPFFPGIFTPLILSEKDDIQVIESATEDDEFIGLVLQQNEVEHATVKDLHNVGVVARIIKKMNLPDGGVNLFISVIKRFKITKTLHKASPIVVGVEYLEDEEADTFEVKALTRALISEMKELVEDNSLFTEEMRLNMINIDNPAKVADFITSILSIDKEEQQKILEITNVRHRMEQILVFIKKEQELLRVQKKVQMELNERIDKSQREYFLREELKAIQEELGENDSAMASDYKKFKSKIDEFNFEGEVKETVYNELEKFRILDSSSPEYTTSRNYLELITQLPWNQVATEEYNLEKATQILNNDHFGLDDVKKRIEEYLAVRKLKKDNKGSILLLVGPPGVGKTSIGKSIANAMNKSFYRFSVGGMHDESEIKGHRRTYIGSMPGKIIQGIKITKSSSPVFMIDEIDKMGVSHNGDPAAALLEVLDPEQNVSFRDTYLDLPFDISNIFFILTANTLDSIPGPLLDRAEIIHLSGYIDQEKLEIAKKYLIPKNAEKNGLKKNQVKYTKKALLRIAEEYAREAGVRNYEKNLDKIHRKIVTELIKQSEIPVTETVVESPFLKKFVIDAPDLEKYLGKPIFDESNIKKASVPGTAIGLAWTSMGGDTLLIEATSFAGKGGLVLTGQMGDVMKESCSIAFNWCKKFVIDRKIKKPDWFEKNTIHLHIPEGATPKDGPSAGITMITTFLSLLTNKVIKQNLAMTGEVSLTGQVLPIGGLREKTVAAKRNKIKTIIIPKANERDLEEIPQIVKDGITFILVSHVSQVIQEALKINS